MDLGLAGKKAIVCAASKGLGKGCASSLANNGVDVTICARTSETLEAAAEEIRALGGGAVPTVASTSPPKKVAPRFSTPAHRRISWSTTPAVRRRGIFATGTATSGLPPLTPTC